MATNPFNSYSESSPNLDEWQIREEQHERQQERLEYLRDREEELRLAECQNCGSTEGEVFAYDYGQDDHGEACSLCVGQSGEYGAALRQEALAESFRQTPRKPPVRQQFELFPEVRHA